MDFKNQSFMNLVPSGLQLNFFVQPASFANFKAASGGYCRLHFWIQELVLYKLHVVVCIVTGAETCKSDPFWREF